MSNRPPARRRLVTISIGISDKDCTSFTVDVPSLGALATRVRVISYTMLADLTDVAVVRWDLSTDVLAMCGTTYDSELDTDPSVTYRRPDHIASTFGPAWTGIEPFAGGQVQFQIKTVTGAALTGTASGHLDLLMEFR